MEGHFYQLIENKELSIGVVGLGYVGLPTAIAFYQAGFHIWGIDTSESVVDSIVNRENPIGDPAIDGKIPDSSSERWNITNSFNIGIPNCDVILVTVPTPINENKAMDASFVSDAGRDIFENIQFNSKAIVVLESTVYPGSTREHWHPIIEDSGLEMGQNIWIAYCPERHNPGDTANSISNVSRVIGCDDRNVGEILVRLYSEITSGDVKYVGAIEVAESAKLIENVQRDINIALVNELSTILPGLGVDLEDVLDAASTKWNFHRYKPGIGVGGHCIPVDPYFIIDQAKFTGVKANLISSAREINESMPDYAARQILEILDSNYSNPERKKRALVLGWSYKPGVGDTRDTPSKPLANYLMKKGVDVLVYDPFVDTNEEILCTERVENLNNLENVDIIVIATAHKEFLGLDWDKIPRIMKKPIIYDGRRCLDLKPLELSGWIVSGIGRNSSQ